MPTSRKRILYVENGIGYGGAIICLRHLVRNLDKNKYEAMVITGRNGPQYQEIAQEAKWKCIPDRRIDISNLRNRLDKGSLTIKSPNLAKVLSQLLSRFDDIVNFLPSLIGTLVVARRFKPALIHANNEPLCNRAALLAGKILGIPVISHVRGDQQGSRMMQLLYQIPTYFIAVSRWISEGIGKTGIPPERRTFIYDGIELENLNLHADGISFRDRHQIPREAFVVGLVGLLIPWKGQRLFLEAVRTLIGDIPELVPVIVGGTPEECISYEAELKQLAADDVFQGRVIFTGHVKDMAEVYNGLDVVVSASTQPEPLGTMIIECLAMGRPLVAPNHGGAIEMVDHGTTGLLFAPGDSGALAEQIRWYYQHPSSIPTFSHAARAKALTTFSISEHIRHVQAVYEQILSADPDITIAKQEEDETM